MTPYLYSKKKDLDNAILQYWKSFIIRIFADQEKATEVTQIDLLEEWDPDEYIRKILCESQAHRKT